METGPSARLIKLTEELLEEERKSRILRLKNGVQIEASEGRIRLMDLEGLLEHHPDHFKGLLALARGKQEEVSAETIRFLGESRIFLRAGEINPDVRDVLLSAYQETAEGPVLVNPFRFTSVEEAREMEREEKRNADRLIREIFEDDDDRNKGDPPMRR